VADICRRLDGIPLALDLAAARAAALSVQDIATRLDDCFHLLTGGSRTALERHRTLRAAIDWSHELLCPIEQTLFRRLSFFAGGWKLEAAGTVCKGEPLLPSNVLDTLMRLVDHSLVNVQVEAHPRSLSGNRAPLRRGAVTSFRRSCDVARTVPRLVPGVR
jgi:predicted ATPase